MQPIPLLVHYEGPFGHMVRQKLIIYESFASLNI